MPPSRRCPDCGATLPGEPAEGLCHRCLLRVGLDDSRGQDTIDSPSPEAPAASGGGPTESARVRYFGDYELQKEIARGGMGVVWLARQVSLNRLVALKMIKSGQFADEREIQRFREEAEAAGNLDHHHIVPIYEVGEHEGQQYFSMKLIDGKSLDHCLRDFKGRPHAIAAVMIPVARAVHHAHQRGVLHRDLKPANILIDAEKRPHVTDFGLAKRIEGDKGLTQSGALVGTPEYMAPEQAQGQKTLTTAADVYSLGAVLYTLLTGEPPFRADSVLATLRLIAEQEPARPRSVDPKIDRDLETICLKCLEKDPLKRYASADALADDLTRFCENRPIAARAVGPLERGWRWCRRNPAVASLVALAAVLLLGGTAVSAHFAYESNGRAREALDEKARADRNAHSAELHAQSAELEAKLAQRQARAANSLRLASQSRQVFPEAPQRSILYALEAMKTTKDHGERVLPAAQEALRDALAQVGGVPLEGRATFDDSGRWLAAVGRRTVLWDLRGDNPKKVIDAERCQTASFSRDSRWLVTWHSVAGGMSVRLWDLTAPNPAEGSIPLDRGLGSPHAFASGNLGRWLVVYASDREIRVWDLDKKEPQHAKPIALTYTEKIGGALVSSRGDWLVVSEVESVKSRLYRLATSDPEKVVAERDGHVQRFSPDGRWVVLRTVANKRYDRYQLWKLEPDTVADKPLDLLPAGPTLSVVFSDDGRWVAASEGQYNRPVVRLWNLKDSTKEPVALREMTCLGAFSADGNWLVTGDIKNAGALLWDLRGKAPTPMTLENSYFDEHSQPQVISFTKDSQFLVNRRLSGRRYDLLIWNLKSPALAPPAAFVLHDNAGGIATPDGRWLVTKSTDGAQVQLWSSKAKDVAEPLAILRGHDKANHHVDLTTSPDGKWLVAASGLDSRLWRLPDRAHPLPQSASPHILQAPPHEVDWAADKVDDCFMDPKNRWLVVASSIGGGYHRCGSWALGGTAPVPAPDAFGGEHVLEFSRDGDWALLAKNNELRFRPVTDRGAQGGRILHGPGRDYSRRATLIDPKNRWVVASYSNLTKRDELVYVWDRLEESSKPRWVLRGHTTYVADMSFSGDGRWLITSGTDRKVRRWDLHAANPPDAFEELPKKAAALAASADGRWLLTTTLAEVEDPPPPGPRKPLVNPPLDLWDLRLGQFKDPILIADGASLAAFSPCGRWLAIGGQGDSIRLRDLRSDDPTRVRHAFVFRAQASEFAFSSKGRWLAAAGRDSFVRLWDLEAEEPARSVVTLRGHRYEVRKVRFTPDDRYLISVGTGDARLWHLDLDQLVEAARRAVDRPLTDEEKQQLGP